MAKFHVFSVVFCFLVGAKHWKLIYVNRRDLSFLSFWHISRESHPFRPTTEGVHRRIEQSAIRCGGGKRCPMLVLSFQLPLQIPDAPQRANIARHDLSCRGKRHTENARARQITSCYERLGDGRGAHCCLSAPVDRSGEDAMGEGSPFGGRILFVVVMGILFFGAFILVVGILFLHSFQLRRCECVGLSFFLM